MRLSDKQNKIIGGAVPTVRIHLVQDIHVIPECVAAQVQIDGDVNTNMQPLLAESDRVLEEKKKDSRF